MKRAIIIFQSVLILTSTAPAQDRENEIIDTSQGGEALQDIYPDPGTGEAKDGTRRFGIILQSGLLLAKNLYAAETPNPLFQEDLNRGGYGFPLGGGLYYFINDKVICGVDLVYTHIESQSKGLFSNKTLEMRTWSITEYSINLKYILSPHLKTSLYAEAGFKIVRLEGTYQDRYPETGPIMRTKTSLIPGGELAIGLTGVATNRVTLYGEVGLSYSHLKTKGKEITLNGQNPGWEYPDNVRLLRLTLGMMISIGGQKREN
jgi:hypothetical protein